VVIPQGNNPDYALWVSEINGKDVSPDNAGNPVTKNNDTGILFLSSNDIQYNGYQNEDLKFNLYVAEFVDDLGVPITDGQAVFKSLDEEQGIIKQVKGSFISGEKVFLSDYQMRFAKLTFSSNTGVFTTGERIYQSNGSANVATGFVQNMNTTSIQVYDSIGVWSTFYQVKGVSSTANAVLSSTSQNVSTTSGSNTVSVPFANVNQIAANMWLYFTTPEREISDVAKVTGINTLTGTITLSKNLSFTSSNTGMGRVRGDGGLYGFYTGPTSNYVNPNRIPIMIDFSTANSTVNFSVASGRLLIGGKSQASANVMTIMDRFYDSVLPQISHTEPEKTAIDWNFYGANNDTNKTPDSTPTKITPYVEKFFDDKERTVMSRSNEFTYMPALRTGNSSMYITANLTTSNTLLSPTIDSGILYATFTSNYLVPENYLEGYFVEISRYDGLNIQLGNTVYQMSGGVNTGVGEIIASNATHLTISKVTGYFSNTANLVLYTSEGVNTSNTYPLDVKYYNESRETNYLGSSRYISKSVSLATGQEAEDIRCFLTAYRPADTNLFVYAKIQNRNDMQRFSTKGWSNLLEQSSGSLLSSSSLKTDYVELEYSFPISNELFSNTCHALNAVTFNGTSAVNVSENSIAIPYANSKFSVGDKVLYRSVTGAPITGLANNTYYYISFANVSKIALKETYSSTSNIDITVVGSSDTGHSLVGDSSNRLMMVSTSGVSQGDMIYISDNIKSQFNVRRVKSVISSTYVELQHNTSFSSTNCAVGVIPGLQSRDGAFVYSINNNICRYVSMNDVVYDGYSLFSIKIVPVSNTTYTVPRVADFRAIALQV
jgi:hypothetical protein